MQSNSTANHVHSQPVNKTRRSTKKTGLLPRDAAQIEKLRQDFIEKKVLVSQILTLCPLPISKDDATTIIRETRTPNQGKITVKYHATSEGIDIPFGNDAVLLDLLCSEARRRNSLTIPFDTVSEIMELMGLNTDAGKLRKQTLERVERITHLVIDVEFQDKIGLKVCVISSRKLPTYFDLENYEKIQDKITDYGITFSRDFESFMMPYIPIPLRAVRAFTGNPTDYALMKKIFHRVLKAESESVIPWDCLHSELGCCDSNIRRFRHKVETMITKIAIGWPEINNCVTTTAFGLQVKRSQSPID
jgi:hypothetical protein